MRGGSAEGLVPPPLVSEVLAARKIVLMRSGGAGVICDEAVSQEPPPLPGQRRLDLFDLLQVVVEVPAQELESLDGI